MRLLFFALENKRMRQNLCAACCQSNPLIMCLRVYDPKRSVLSAAYAAADAAAAAVMLAAAAAAA
eukprot:6852-Heterococcus_DN1.PRE.1